MIGCQSKHATNWIVPRLVLCLALIVAIGHQRAQAKTLDEAVAAATDNIVRYLKAHRHNSISVGDFSGPPQLTATGGPGIGKRFRDALAANDIAVRQRSQVGLRGQFALKRRDDKVYVEIVGSLVDPFGEVLTDFTFDASAAGLNNTSKDQTVANDASNEPSKQPPADLPPGLSESVTDAADVAELVGATTRLYPEDSDSDRQKDLADSLVRPSFHLDGSRIYAAAGDHYAIEIICDGQPLAVRDEDGHAFVSIRRDQQYAIRLINASSIDAAVFVSIDGLSIFEFSELRGKDNRPLYRHYILPPDPAGRAFHGWHKTNDRVERFVVTAYGDSAVGLYGTPADSDAVGTITVRFHAAWDPAGPPPEDEDTTKGASATGFGPSMTQTAKEVRRQVGRLRSAISVRYVK